VRYHPAATSSLNDPLVTTLIGGGLSLAGGILTALWLRNKDAASTEAGRAKRLRAAATTIDGELAGNHTRLAEARGSRRFGRLEFSFEHYLSSLLFLAEEAPIGVLEALHEAYEPLRGNSIYDTTQTTTGIGSPVVETVQLSQSVATLQMEKIEEARKLLRTYRDGGFA
jgi:hypothetical protein